MVFPERFSENGGKPLGATPTLWNQWQRLGLRNHQTKKRFCASLLLAFSGMCVSPKAYEIGSGKFKPNEFVGLPYKLSSFSKLGEDGCFRPVLG